MQCSLTSLYTNCRLQVKQATEKNHDYISINKNWNLQVGTFVLKGMTSAPFCLYVVALSLSASGNLTIECKQNMFTFHYLSVSKH